jgi:hypothetical protein
VPLDWGSVPEAIGAVLTGASFGVAAIAYRRSVGDKAGAQAAVVSAWFETADGETSVLCVRNGSAGAIYEVVALLPISRDEVDLKSIPPETTMTHVIDTAVGVRGPAPVRFRDGMGRYWRRDHDGRLTCFGGPDLSMKNAKRYKLFK